MFPRVYFDTNDGAHASGYELNLPTSLKDLEALGDDLRSGTVVTIYMTNELEMTATLRFDAAAGIWMADPVEGTIKYLDGSD